MKKNLIALLLTALGYSCSSPPSYNYNASNVISYLQGYKDQVPIPYLVIHRDSSFSIRENCYFLMKDNRIYLYQESNIILLSKDEVKKMFEHIRQDYLRQKRTNLEQNNKSNNHSKKHGYREEYFG